MAGLQSRTLGVLGHWVTALCRGPAGSLVALRSSPTRAAVVVGLQPGAGGLRELWFHDLPYDWDHPAVAAHPERAHLGGMVPIHDPLVVGDELLVTIVQEGDELCFEARELPGRDTRWRVGLAEPGPHPGPMAGFQGAVGARFLPQGDALLVVRRRIQRRGRDGKLLWERELSEPVMNHAASSRVMWVAQRASLRALSLATGEDLGQVELATPAVVVEPAADGALVCVGRGEVCAVDVAE